MESTTEKTYTKSNFNTTLNLFNKFAAEYAAKADNGKSEWESAYYLGRSEAYKMAASFLTSDLEGVE